MAESYVIIPSYPHAAPKEMMPLANTAVAKALELDAELPEAHTVSGMIAAVYDWDWPKAESEFKRSLELDPNLALTHYRYAWVYLSPMGRHDEAIAEMKRSLELEPLAINPGANFAGVLVYARQFDAAIEQAQKTFELDPGQVTAQNWVCHSLNAKGRWAECLEFAAQVKRPDYSFYSQLSYSYAIGGRRQEAEAIIEQWKEAEKTKYIANYWVAISYGALGDKEAAFAHLEKAYQAHDWFLQRIKVDPFLDPLRGDPRFTDLVKRIGLTP